MVDAIVMFVVLMTTLWPLLLYSVEIQLLPIVAALAIGSALLCLHYCLREVNNDLPVIA